MAQDSFSMSQVRIYGGSGQLYRCAAEIFLAMNQDVGDRSPCKRNTLACIVLATASVEGFVNEFGEMIYGHPGDADSLPPGVVRVGDALEFAAKVRSRIEDKVNFVYKILSQERDVLGREPWQSFTLLKKMRNGLVHLESGSADILKPTLVVDNSETAESLRTRKLIAEADGTLAADWITQCQTRAVARWSCETASNCVLELIECVSSYKNELQKKGFEGYPLRINLQAFGEAFAPPDEFEKEQ